MDLVGKYIGSRYEILEVIGKVEWQQCIGQNAMY